MCLESYTDCGNCYTATVDLLGLQLFKLGCLDNMTREEACPYNYYIQACSVETCKNDHCNRGIMEKAKNESGNSGAVGMSWRIMDFWVVFSIFSLVVPFIGRF